MHWIYPGYTADSFSSFSKKKICLTEKGIASLLIYRVCVCMLCFFVYSFVILRFISNLFAFLLRFFLFVNFSFWHIRIYVVYRQTYTFTWYFHITKCIHNFRSVVSVYAFCAFSILNQKKNDKESLMLFRSNTYTKYLLYKNLSNDVDWKKQQKQKNNIQPYRQCDRQHVLWCTYSFDATFKWVLYYVHPYIIAFEYIFSGFCVFFGQKIQNRTYELYMSVCVYQFVFSIQFFVVFCSFFRHAYNT